MARIEVELIPPVRVIQMHLSTTALAIKTLRVPMQTAVRTVLAPRFYDNFDDGGGNQPWRPLALSTVAWKFNNGYPRVALEPLKRTGLLQKRAGQINNWRITSDSAAFNSLNEDAYYGVYHQTGYTNARTQSTVPARPWADIKDSDMNRIEGIFEVYAMAVFGGI